MSSARRLLVDGSGTTQPISAASLPLPTGASTSANQTTANTSLANIESDADATRISVELLDDSVATLGTTTYAEATTKGLIIGAIRRDADTTAVGTDNEVGPLQMDANGRLKVEIFDGGDSHTVDGTVTANAGTNLNTSALAVETGGNLAGAAASLAILDDWDETDRCKVNIIAGQAGVDGNSGVVSALTQRVVLATNVALPAGTNNIGDVDVLSSRHGLTIVNVSGTTSSSGDTTLVTADVSNRILVFAFSLTTTVITANTIKFTDGAAGAEFWRVILQAISGGSFGANLAVSPPAWLFGNAVVNTALVMNLSAATAVHYSIAYFKLA